MSAFNFVVSHDLVAKYEPVISRFFIGYYEKNTKFIKAGWVGVGEWTQKHMGPDYPFIDQEHRHMLLSEMVETGYLEKTNWNKGINPMYKITEDAIEIFAYLIL